MVFISSGKSPIVEIRSGSFVKTLLLDTYIPILLYLINLITTGF